MSPTFDDRRQPPGDASLAAALGKAKRHWDALVACLDGHDGVTREWKYYGAKLGWQLKAVVRKRALLYMIPRAGSFTAAMALREDELTVVRALGLPASFMADLEGAKVSVEGRPARVEVTGEAAVDLVKRLLAVRLGARR